MCFIYKEDYQPALRQYSKRSIAYYQPKSGTRLAYEYIKQKRNNFINVAEIHSWYGIILTIKRNFK